MTYNSKEYWSERKNPNKYPEVHEHEARFISKHIEEARYITDIGCGVGRCFPLYEGKWLSAVDFVETFKEQAKESADRSKLNTYLHLLIDFRKPLEMPFPKKYDAGLLISVLLHATDEEARAILKNARDSSEKVIVISSTVKEGLSDHCFYHDYEKLIEELGFEMIEVEYIDNQIMFVYG